MIQIFDITEDTELLPIVLHLNNLSPMYKKWPHTEQTRWRVHAKWFDLLEQVLEFQNYIQEWYKVIATIASQVAISASLSSPAMMKDRETRRTERARTKVSTSSRPG